MAVADLVGAIDELFADGGGASCADGESVLALVRQLARLEALATDAVGAFASSGEWATDGSKSASAWLAGHGHLKPADARRYVRRDQRCCHPTCMVPFPDCEADHIVPAGKGGPTIQANGRLLCPFHNKLRNRMDDAAWGLPEGPVARGTGTGPGGDEAGGEGACDHTAGGSEAGEDSEDGRSPP